MDTFRIDIEGVAYLLLDSPSRKLAREWMYREVPEPPDMLSIRIATIGERLDYVIGGFYVRQLSDTMESEADEL